MEGMGLFNIARGNKCAPRSTTRASSNPIFGAKLTGTIGKTTFGVLMHSTTIPARRRLAATTTPTATRLHNRPGDDALRRSDYFGAIVTQTTHTGRNNFATGVDFIVAPLVGAVDGRMFLTTRTTGGTSDTRGNAAQLTYEYETAASRRRCRVSNTNRDFQMDTAFYPDGLYWRLDDGRSTSIRRGQELLAATNHPFVFAKAGATAFRRRRALHRRRPQFSLHAAGQLQHRKSRVAKRPEGRQFKAANISSCFSASKPCAG